MFTRIARLAVATLLGAVALLVSPLVASSASAAMCPQYPAMVTTTTTLSISPSTVAKGQSFTATATVTASTGPAPTGVIVFKYGSQRREVTLVPGTTSSTASATFTATGTRAVKARYPGKCAESDAEAGFGPSHSRTVILGAEANRAAPTTSGSSAGTSALAATGASGQTELFGLLGLGMIVVGGLALVVHRRRVNG